jgi:hypothetical protein
MRVILRQEIFESDNTNPLDLFALFRLGLDIDSPHLIQTEPLQAKEIDNWLNRQDDKTRQLCQQILEFGFRRETDINPNFPPATIQVSEVKKPQWNLSKNRILHRLPLDKAVKFLYQPFSIFVENRRNDRAFIEAVATGWRKERLKKFLQNNAIEFNGGGGIGEVLKWVEEIAEIPEKCYRGFALFDSDALKPNEPSKQSEDVVRACHQKIPYHQLKRRAIENYLPYETLATGMGMGVHQQIHGVKKKNLVNAFKQLNPEQRHHFNMKHGFERDKVKHVGNFYDDIPDNVKKTLKRGFGDNIAELFKEEQLKIPEQLLRKENSLTEELNPMLEKLLSLV